MSFSLAPPAPNSVSSSTRRPPSTSPPHLATAGALMLAPVREESSPRPIGRATVERMLGDTFTKVKHESDKAVWVGAAALTAILVVGGITYIYMRQNAVDAGLQAQQSQQAIQQMGQDVKKTPELADAMRQEVARLNDQLKLSDARSEESLRRLSQQLAAQEAATKEEVRELASRQADAPLPGPPAGSGRTVVHPRNGAGRRPQSQADYDAAVRQGIGMLQNGDAAGALKVAQELMQSQPNRWEAYSIAGSVAKVQNRPSQAKTMFERALSLAPDEVKPSLRQALQEIAGGGQ